MKKIFTIAVLIGIAQFCFAQINWKNDIDTLRVELPKKHINLFFHSSEAEFNAGLDMIKNQCDTLSDFEVVVKLQQQIAKLGDSHTRIGLLKFINPELRLPISMYQFTDGVYILLASEDNSNLIGKKIIAINGYPIEQVIDSVNTLITCENQALKKEIFPLLITSTQLLDYFNFKKDGLYYIDIMGDDNLVITQKVNQSPKGTPLVSVNNDSLPYCWSVKKTAFTKEFFDEGKILYVSYNKCIPVSYLQENGNIDTMYFEDFQKQIFSDLKTKGVEKLIFDMRFNGGGNSMYGTNFVNELKKKRIDKKIEIFVIIGRATFSSAILNTIDFEENTNAITVGEETGGKPNHYGEIRSLILPSSKLEVIYSTKYFKHIDSDINTIVPKIPIQSSFQDFIHGIDPVYEWIKEQNTTPNNK